MYVGIDPAYRKKTVAVVVKEHYGFKPEIVSIISFDKDYVKEAFELIDMFDPEVFGIETSYMGKNVKTKEKIDFIRHKIMTLCELRYIDVMDIPPSKWRGAFNIKKDDDKKHVAKVLFRNKFESIDEIEAALIAVTTMLSYKAKEIIDEAISREENRSKPKKETRVQKS